MEQNEKTKGTKKVKDQISEGFYSEIGASLAKILGKILLVIIVMTVSFFGSYFGGKKGLEKVTMQQQDTTTIIINEDTTSIVTKSISKPTIIVNNKDFKAAKEYELKGFKALVDKDFDSAFLCFEESQNSANGYHASYEIKNYLENHKNSVSEPDFWDNTYNFVIENYWGFIPKDVLTEMKKSINSQN